MEACQNAHMADERLIKTRKLSRCPWAKKAPLDNAGGTQQRKTQHCLLSSKEDRC